MCLKKCIVCGDSPRVGTSTSCAECHGQTFVSTLNTIGETDLVIDFPSVENGSSCLLIASIQDLKENDCFDGDNNIVLYDTEKQDIFAKHLKKFFAFIEIDGFTKEQNDQVRKEIENILDGGLDELDQVFLDTVKEMVG